MNAQDDYSALDFAPLSPAALAEFEAQFRSNMFGEEGAWSEFPLNGTMPQMEDPEQEVFESSPPTGQYQQSGDSGKVNSDTRLQPLVSVSGPPATEPVSGHTEGYPTNRGIDKIESTMPVLGVSPPIPATEEELQFLRSAPIGTTTVPEGLNGEEQPTHSTTVRPQLEHPKQYEDRLSGMPVSHQAGLPHPTTFTPKDQGTPGSYGNSGSSSAGFKKSDSQRFQAGANMFAPAAAPTIILQNDTVGHGEADPDKGEVN